MATDVGRTAAVWFLVLITIAGGLVCVGCDSKGGRDGTLQSAYGRQGTAKGVSDCVDELKAAYLADGMHAFDAKRKLMIANESLLRSDPEYDTVGMVLGLGETEITRKEAELAKRLRTLAKYIEAHPRRSGVVWMRLTDKLYSYSFGNGPIGEDSVPVKLAALYEVIAKGDHNSRVGTAESISDWVVELRTIYLVDGIQGFYPTKGFMIAEQSALRSDPDYDTAVMVLGLGETDVTKKEAELTAQLRTLATYIEAHPGRSRAAWMRLRVKLFSYSFGKGPIDGDSVAVKLVALYEVIAHGNRDLGAGAAKTDLDKALKEAKENFTVHGKPVHPGLIYDLKGWMSDRLPITVAVDLLAARDSNEYYEPEVKLRAGWIECDIRGYRPATQDECRFGYQRKGVLDDRTQVLRVYYWPGGSGTFMYLMFIRFDTEKAFDLEMKPYTRLLMKLVCLYALGDNDDGEVTVLSDHVIVGKSKYRDKEIVLKLD